jgi:hypothetical protein
MSTPDTLTQLELALSGAGGDDQQRIAATGLEWLGMLLDKNRDYGSSVWKPPILSPRLDVAEAIFVRLSDKIERIRSLRQRGGDPAVDESLDDTLRDLAGYCLLLLARPDAED